MSSLKSELTWSFSRDRLFQECRRAYYFHYYASWGGWDASAELSARQAYMLRNIRTIDAWIGDIVHQIIKWIVVSRARGQIVGLDAARERVKKNLLHTWEQSRSRAWERNVKNNLNLFEHYYNRDLSGPELQNKLSKAAVSIENMYRCGILEKISSIGGQSVLPVDELDTFDFEGTKVFAAPDFALRQDDTFELYDWKTGKPQEKDAWQLSLYMLYASAKWHADVSCMRVAPVYLAFPDVSIAFIEPRGKEEIEHYVRISIAAMKDILRDAETNSINFAECPRTSQLWRCAGCRFQEICPPS